MNKIFTILAALFFSSFSFFANAATHYFPPVSIHGGLTRLSDIGLYHVEWKTDNGTVGMMPPGWMGHFDERSGISVTPFGEQNGKQVTLIHPPWRAETGSTRQTFLLTLPKARRISLKSYVAMKEGEVGPQKSDGATFHIFVDDKEQVQQNITDSTWLPLNIDLTPWAGKSIQLGFETDPGPKRSPSFDFALWGDREISVEGAVDTLVKKAMPAQPGGTLFQGTPTDLLDGWRIRLSGQNVALTGQTWLDLIAEDGRMVRSDSPEVNKSIQQTAGKNGRVLRQITYKLGNRVIRALAEFMPAANGQASVKVTGSDPWIAAIHF